MHVNNPSAEVFLKDGSLNDGPDDEAFLLSLRRSLKTARGVYPPVALAEIYQEYKSPLTKIRRLHLMVVDLSRSRSVSKHVYQDFMNCHDLAGCLNTLPVPISRKDCPFKARFVFAYGVDNSDKPSYLMWPIRGVNGQFLLVDPWSGNSLDRKRPLKVDAAAALHIPVNDVSDFSKSETSEESSWLLTSEFDPELALASSSELPFALSSLLGGIGTSLAELFFLLHSRASDQALSVIEV